MALKLLYVSTKFRSCVIEPSCRVEEALVNGTNPIPDAQTTASSEYNSKCAARQARINNTIDCEGWVCSIEEYEAPEPRMYIQVCVYVIILELFAR